MNFKSTYIHLAGKTLHWLTTDTEEQYKENLKRRYDDLEKFNWIDKTIHYTFNSQGFRCEEFEDYPNVMCVGCSLTLGTGIPEEQTWAQIVSRSLGLKCYNLGIGGGSCDTAFRLTYGWIDKLNPKILIFRRPPGARFELVTDTKIDHYFISLKNKFQNFLFEWAAQDNNNTELNFLKNSLAIQQLCQERNIKCVIIDHDESLINFNHYDLARDLIHPGIKSNQIMAEKILETIR